MHDALFCNLHVVVQLMFHHGLQLLGSHPEVCGIQRDQAFIITLVKYPSLWKETPEVGQLRLPLAHPGVGKQVERTKVVVPMECEGAHSGGKRR